MEERDADFSEPTKLLIARRAGYRCSFSGCDQSTIGPGAGPEDVERKGTAAHIFSASSGTRAPHGTGGLSADDRSKAANGIWMCRDHGDIVDNDKGKNYPATLLQAWKALQETRIAQELRKVPVTQNAWLEKVTIETNPLLTSGSTIAFGKVTLFVGDNGTGKSALCEWLSGSAGYIEDLRRWRCSGTKEGDLHLRLGVLQPDRVEFAMHLRGPDLICEFGGKKALDLSHVLRVLYIREHRREEFEDDVEFLAKTWRVHPYQVPQVLRDMSSSKYGYVKSAKLRHVSEEDGYVESKVPKEVMRARKGRAPFQLDVVIGGNDFPVVFDGLSGTERSQVIVSGAMVIADHYSSHQSTVLILELGAQLFSDGLLSCYADKLQSAEFRFQTILVSADERPDVNWTGWSIARFLGNPPSVSVEQNRIGDE